MCVCMGAYAFACACACVYSLTSDGVRWAVGSFCTQTSGRVYPMWRGTLEVRGPVIARRIERHRISLQCNKHATDTAVDGTHALRVFVVKSVLLSRAVSGMLIQVTVRWAILATICFFAITCGERNVACVGLLVLSIFSKRNAT